jgi:hypothetical protein
MNGKTDLSKIKITGMDGSHFINTVSIGIDQTAAASVLRAGSGWTLIRKTYSGFFFRSTPFFAKSVDLFTAHSLNLLTRNMGSKGCREGRKAPGLKCQDSAGFLPACLCIPGILGSDLPQ